MTALNKQALRMRNYLDTALKSGVKLLHLSTGELEGLLDELQSAEGRIAELEARELAVKQFDGFQIVHYGATEDYAKGYIDCQNNYKALAAAGIGVKGE